MRKLTIEVIKSKFEEEGYKLLTTNYINNRQKLEYICPNNHKHSISWGDWVSGCRCFYCGISTSSNKRKLSFEFVKSSFDKEGYTLLTANYTGNTQKLEYVCPNNHRSSITWASWNQGIRCSRCSGNVKKTISFIRSEFEKEGYTLLSNKYTNNHTKLDYVCNNGHRHSIKWSHFRDGHRCPYCCNHSSIGLDFDYILDSFVHENYTLISNSCENAKTSLLVRCPKGHLFRIMWNNWQQGQRCPRCSNKVSRWEGKIKKFITTLGINYVSNDRTVLVNPNTGHSLELDIWLPSLNKAIECNGVHWHSDEQRKQCDDIKLKLCSRCGIGLLVITDKEWNKDTHNCRNKIKKFLIGDF